MVEIIIQLVLYKDARFIPGLVKSLRQQSFSNYKVFALENCSDDDTGEIFKQFMPEGLLFLSVENLGFSGGHNFLLKETLKTGAPYLVVLNTDVELHEDFLWHLHSQIQQDERVGAVGPVICNPQGNFNSNTIQNYRLFMNFSKGTKYSPDSENPFHSIDTLPAASSVDYLSGVAMMLRSCVFEKMYLWDKSLFMYGEERDFFYRFKQAGFRAVVAKNAVCWHLHDWSSGNAKSYRREYYYLRRNKILYFKKYRLKSGLFRFILMEVFKFPLTFLWTFRKGGLPMFYYYWLGIWHGLLGRSGKFEPLSGN